jgi:glycosyltransferase involved in cell wall biosynthesis
MRILLNYIQLTSERLGGGWTYSINLLRGLEDVAASHEIIVLVSKSVAPKVNCKSANLLTIEMKSEDRIQRVTWEHLKLPGIVKSIHPDVFHGPANTLPLKLSCPSVMTIHDFYHIYCPEHLSWLRRHYLANVIPRSLRSATRIIADSNNTKLDAVRLANVSLDKIETIYLGGLNYDEEEMFLRNEETLNKLGIAAPYLLSVGSSLPHKNLPRLIKAFGRVSHQIPHNLILVGEKFGYGNALQAVANKELKNQQNRIRHVGFITRQELITLYRKADAFVLPSLYEGFGIPALEAMQCGCPVISSQLSSLPEVCGDAAEYFDPLNIDNMAESILRVASDSILQSAMRERGDLQSKKFSWQKMASETLNVYHKAISI